MLATMLKKILDLSINDKLNLFTIRHGRIAMKSRQTCRAKATLRLVYRYEILLQALACVSNINLLNQ